MLGRRNAPRRQGKKRRAENARNKIYAKRVAAAAKFVRINIPEFASKITEWQAANKASTIIFQEASGSPVFSLEIITPKNKPLPYYWVKCIPSDNRIDLWRSISGNSRRQAYPNLLLPETFISQIVEKKPRNSLRASFPHTAQDFCQAVKVLLQCAEIEINRLHGGSALRIRR